jgi:hypothetical protein
MAEKEIALKVTTDLSQTNQAFKSAEDRLNETKKRMIELATSGQQASKEFRDLALEAGKIKGQLELVEQTVDGIGKSANKVEVFSGAIQGMAAGFAIAQGTAALFAEGNEELQESLVKVQASLALLQGAEQAVQLLRRESAAGQALLTARTAAYNLVVGTSTGALKLFRLALIATGIGAAVVAVGMLVANWDKLTGAVMKFVNSSPMLTKILDFVTSKFQQLGETLGFLPDATEKSITTQIELFEKQKRLMEAQGKDTTEIERVILAQRLELAKKTNKDIEKAQEDLLLFEQATLFKRGEAAKAAAEKRAEIEKQAIAKSKAEREKDAEELRKMNAEIAEAEVNARKSAQEQLDDILNQIRRSRLTEFEKEQEDFLIQREKMAELMKETGASELELMAFNMNTRSVLENMANQESIDNAKKASETKKEIDRDEFLARQANVQQNLEMTAQALGALTSLYTASLGQTQEDQKKAFEANKKFSIAQALISTFLAVNAALTAGGNPIKLATGAQFVEAGIALTAGLANVIKIKNTKFQGGSTGGGSTASPRSLSGNTPPPQGFNPNQSTPIVPPQGQNGNGQLPPQRVFVLERDIQNVGRRVRNVESFATFG